MIDGKAITGGAVKREVGKYLRTLVLNRAELSLHDKGHLYICIYNKRPETKGSGNANAMSFKR